MGSNGNGHHGNNGNGRNGHKPAGGQGEPTHILTEDDRGHRRQTYQMLNRAISMAMNVPTEVLAKAWATAVGDLEDKDGRIRARAREFLLKMQDSGVTAALGLDKIERLDAGQDTEQVGVRQITLEFDRSG